MDVNKLATLARIKLGEEEKKSFEKEFQAILGFVDQIQEVKIKDNSLSQNTRNIFREDDTVNVSSSNTETILKASPERHGDFVKVKKIL